MLQELMHGIGAALDAPRSLLYKGLNAGADALGGDPSNEWKGFGDVLGSAGMDKDSMLTKALGFAGDVATDPLTWAGLGAAKYARSGLEGASALGKAAATGEGLGKQAFRTELSAVPKFRNVAALESQAAEHLPQAGNRLAVISEGSGGASHMAEVSRGRGLPADDLLERFNRLGRDGLASDANGIYNPLSESVGTAARDTTAAARQTGRHESVHAVIDQARKNGTAADLPLSMRIPASLPSAMNQNASGAKRALSLVAEETAAHGLENRGLMGQMRGAGRFLFDPTRNAAYAGDVSALSPAIGKLYRSLPTAFLGAGAAGGGATGALGRALE